MAGRAEALRSPVEVPAELIANPKARAAIARASETGKPFGGLSFGSSELKDELAPIKVEGKPASTAAHWQRVARHLELLDRLATFCLRWNQLVPDLGLPELRDCRGWFARSGCG